MKVEDYCNALRTWVKLMQEAYNKKADESSFHQQQAEEFLRSCRIFELAIDKSCLLHRTIYCGEQPSETPCPVHEGRWSGITFGWPDQKWSDGKPVEESTMCRENYDKGCRCYLHKCGCTTGWQPDEHCGCGEK